MLFDVIIIGKGPAGLSASLYTTRGNLSTLLIGKDSSLLKAEKIENFCCTEITSGEELIEKGVSQAERLGAQIIEEEVVGLLSNEAGFVVSTDKDDYLGKAIIIATGKGKAKVPITNIEQFTGKGVHYCAVCDSFFYRGAKVGVLGYTDYALHELKEFNGITPDLTLYTSGNNLQINSNNEQYLAEKKIKIRTERIKSVEGDKALQKLIFKDGAEEDINGLFVAYGSASSVDFARRLGIIMENNNLMVDENQSTNVLGVFAAGDCTGGFAQVATAVGQGAVAGEQAKKYVKSLKS